MGPYYEWIGRIANLLHPLLNRTPPHLSSRSIKDIKDVGQLAWSLRKELDERTVADITRLFTMSAADLLERWFEDPIVIGSQSVNGIIGTWAGPMTPGTAYVLMHHSTGEESEGQVASWGMPEGGMGAVSDAIRASAESFGAEIRVGTPVDKVLVKSGRAVGVATASGEEFRAPVVITACHPQITFLRQIDRADLPEEFVEDIERWRSRSGTVKINLALDRLPEFTADPGFDPDVHGGAITILDDLEYLETAFQEARAGHAGHRAVRRLRDPHGLRPHARPRGQARDVDVHAVGARSRGARSRTARSSRPTPTGSSIGSSWSRPASRTSILHRQIIGPYDMEQEYGLIGGNIFHGELTVDQLFHMRPAVGYADYRTPIRGLYQACSATHAGGGVNGLPGHHVVREIRRDKAL